MLRTRRRMTTLTDTPQVCRYELGGRTAVGILLPNEKVQPVPIGSMAELLALPVTEIRRLVDQAGRGDDLTPDRLLAAPDRQEVWAAGVTYERSRAARVAESGLIDVYTRAHEAERPELFFKAPAERVVPPGGAGRLRTDSTWDACEPELVLVVNSIGEIVGYTIGNDLSSRSIEAENPLYLPQAKLYTDSCLLAAGWTPAWYVEDIRMSDITIHLYRGESILWSETISLSRLGRAPEQLIAWLFRDLDFPLGVFLFTGTGLVAPDYVALDDGDHVIISIQGLGELHHKLYRQHAEAASA